MIKNLSYLGFIGSWYVSFLLATTLANTKVDYVVAFIFTSVMQYSSFYFFKIRKKNKHYLNLACVLFAISILGTMSYQLSIHDAAQNEMLTNSDEYLKHKKNITNQETLINDIKISKDELKLSYDEQIKTLVAQRNAMPSNYITRKSEIDTNINALKQELSGKLEKLNSSLIAQTEQLKELNNTTLSPNSLKETKGYLGISNIIANFFEINKEIVVLAIQFIIAIAFEYTAIMLHVSTQKESNEENKTEISGPAKVETRIEGPIENKKVTNISLVKKKWRFSMKKLLTNLKSLVQQSAT